VVGSFFASDNTARSVGPATRARASTAGSSGVVPDPAQPVAPHGAVHRRTPGRSRGTAPTRR
jgi:hypothetical protein